MGNDLGTAYMGQIIAKQMMHEALYGKAKPKKKSFIKSMWKKMSKSFCPNGIWKALSTHSGLLLYGFRDGLFVEGEEERRANQWVKAS